MKSILNKISIRGYRMSLYLSLLALSVVAADVYAGGGGTWGDAATRTTGNLPAMAVLFITIFGVVGVVFTGMGILGFFKQNEPVKVGKQIGLIIAGAALMGLAWIISTTSTSVTGSDQTSSMQDELIVD